VRSMAAVLREHGLLARLEAEDFGVVVPPDYVDSVDAETRVRNAGAIREYSLALAESVGRLLDGGFFPVVLGGDCSILLGSALALRRRGCFGLLFLDGHTDLQTPESSETAGAAGMDLALATGMGPSLLASIDGLGPSIRAADVVVVGYRWPEPGSGSVELPAEAIMALPLEVIRRDGAGYAAAKVVERFAEQSFWMHFDVDVLDPVWMPAVDSPDPGGMSPDEVLTVLRAAVQSPRCVGMEITIYDPTLDPGRDAARLIVDLLGKAFEE
jgi:arginase